jgi:hypothetical protein
MGCKLNIQNLLATLVLKKKGFAKTHIQKDTFHLFFFENGLNIFQFGIFCHPKK